MLILQVKLALSIFMGTKALLRLSPGTTSFTIVTIAIIVTKAGKLNNQGSQETTGINSGVRPA